MSAAQQPVAWMFVQPSGEVRFILHDKARADAWASAHEGDIIPLYRAPPVTDSDRKAIGVAIQQVEAARAQRHPEEDEARSLLLQVSASLQGLLETLA